MTILVFLGALALFGSPAIALCMVVMYLTSE